MSNYIGCLFLSFFLIANKGLAAALPISEQNTETWYQIEILVYEPVNPPIAGEVWPANNDLGIPDDAITLLPPSSSPDAKTPLTAFEQRPTETLTLADIAQKLIKSQRYRIITLQGWQQPVKQRQNAKPVHLTDKPLLSAPPRTTANGDIILNPDANTEDNALPSTGSIEDHPPRIDGTVTVSLSRYLHMALKLRYYNPDVYLAEQIALQKPDEELIDTFMLVQSRRMRSKEVHVFDHPYFGVITTITPVERPVP